MNGSESERLAEAVEFEQNSSTATTTDSDQGVYIYAHAPQLGSCILILRTGGKPVPTMRGNSYRAVCHPLSSLLGRPGIGLWADLRGRIDHCDGIQNRRSGHVGLRLWNANHGTPSCRSERRWRSCREQKRRRSQIPVPEPWRLFKLKSWLLYGAGTSNYKSAFSWPRWLCRAVSSTVLVDVVPCSAQKLV